MRLEQLCGNVRYQKDDNVFANWQRFQRYVLRINPPNPADPAAPKIEFPKADDSNGIAELLAWAQRFFDLSGDVWKMPSTR